jgi:putative endonuclease
MWQNLLRLSDALRHRARLRVWNPERAAGRRGEDLAHRFLRRAGYTVVARNYRTATGSGEVDVVAWDGETLVFVEVKSRRSEEYGAPDRAIDQDKRRRLLRAARDCARRADVPWEKVRFDVVNVVFTNPPSITHFKDAFRTAV